MVSQFVWKKKWPYIWLLTDSSAVANGLAGSSGNWKDHDWKIGEKDIWERNIWIDHSKWAKEEKIFVSHVNAHQKVVGSHMCRCRVPLATAGHHSYKGSKIFCQDEVLRI
jgi:ribonuclease HI